MKIDIRNITDNGLSLKFSKNVDFFPVLKELTEKEEYIFLTPVNTDINVYYTADKYIEVKGVLTTSIKIACDRCLKKFPHPMTTEFKLKFSDKKPVLTDGGSHDEDGIEIPEGEIEIEYYDGDIIQLKNCIQEQVILAFPYRALCSEDCSGLCQKCGGNLNDNKCGCEKDVGHPAFAALKNLKTKK